MSHAIDKIYRNIAKAGIVMYSTKAIASTRITAIIEV